MKILCFKFHQNRANSLWGSQGGQSGPISKNRKKLGPNPDRKFQHSSSIKKCLKIAGTDSAFGAVKASHEGGRGT